MKHSIVQTLLLRIVVLTVLSAMLSGAWAAQPLVLRFSHVVSANDPKGIGAELFKKLAEERLAGKVRVEVYPDSRLFADEQVLPALLFGDVQLAAPSLSKFGNFTHQLQVFDLPFLFDSVEAVHRFQAGATGQKLLDSMQDKGIKGLAYWDNGMRVISANRPLRAPADVAGLKFRIESSDVIEAQYETLDALPLKLSFDQVRDALQAGLVDGQENSWSNIASQKFYELEQSFTETRHSILGYMVVTSAKFWDSLPAEVRTGLEQILVEVTAEVNRVAREKAESGRQQVIAAGATVIEPSPAETGMWVEALKPVWQRFEDSIGKEIVEAAVAANREEVSSENEAAAQAAKE